MTNRLKPGKVALVVFLTVLIWVWADLAQDDTISLTNRMTLGVVPSASVATWIVFKKGESNRSSPADVNAADGRTAVKKDETGRPGIVLDSVDLKGPAKKVADLRRARDTGKLDLALYLDPNQEGLQSEGPHVFDVLSYLKRNDQIERLGLSVESCEPSKVTVEVQNLEKRSVAVECVDADNKKLDTALITPASVLAWVPKDGVLTARVILTAEEQREARIKPVPKIPIVELAPGQERSALDTVQVKLRSEQVDVAERTVQVTLGICFSQNLQGKYQVNLLNASDFATVAIQATLAATDEFTNRQDFQLILDIIDGDEASKPGAEPLQREIRFRFPQAYVQRGEIQESPVNPPKKAKFTLVPVSEVKPTLPK